MATAHLSREARLYLALWRRALSTDEGYSFELPSRGVALSTRQGLYRAIKRFRGRPDLDEQLSDAADRYVISFDLENPARLWFTPRKSLAPLEAQLAELGISEDDLLTPQELAAKQSADRLLAGVTLTTKSNPFFERD